MRSRTARTLWRKALALISAQQRNFSAVTQLAPVLLVSAWSHLLAEDKSAPAADQQTGVLPRMQVALKFPRTDTPVQHVREIAAANQTILTEHRQPDRFAPPAH